MLFTECLQRSFNSRRGTTTTRTSSSCMLLMGVMGAELAGRSAALEAARETKVCAAEASGV